MLPKAPRDKVSPPDDPPPMLFEPEEFPEGLDPIPGERFTHGNWPGGVFFRDERFPGKTFIYAFTYSQNAYSQPLEKKQFVKQDDNEVPDDEQLFDGVDDTGETILNREGMVRPSDSTGPVYESTAAEDTNTQTATGQVAKDIEENVIAGFADQPHSTEEWVENAVQASQQGEVEISRCGVAKKSDASSQPSHSSNAPANYDHPQDADLSEIAVNLEDVAGLLPAYEKMPAKHIAQLIDGQSSGCDAALMEGESTFLVSPPTPQPPGTDSEHFYGQRYRVASLMEPITSPRPEEDSEYFIPEHKIAIEIEYSGEDQHSATEALISVSPELSSFEGRESMDFQPHSSATGVISDIASGHGVATASLSSAEPEHSIEHQYYATEALISESPGPSSFEVGDSMDFEPGSSATGEMSDTASGHDAATARLAPVEPEHPIEDQHSAAEAPISVSSEPSSVRAQDSMGFEPGSSATGMVSDIASEHDAAIASLPPVEPEPYSEQEPVDLEANVAFVNVRSDEDPDQEPSFEEHYSIFSDPNEELLAWYENLQAVEAAQKERYEQLQKRILDGVDIPSIEEINKLLDYSQIRQDSLAEPIGKSVDESRGVASHPVEPVVTESDIPEPARPKQLCSPGQRYDTVPRRLPRNIFGIDVPDCETFCQGLTGVILVFYFFRPDKIPYFFRRMFAGRISPTTVSQWWWLRLMLGFMIIVRLSEWGRPEGLFEPVCHIEKPERWPQIWYYPDSAIPRFAPREDVTERERRW